MTDESFYGQLCWALRHLAKWGKSADPHVRYEAKTQAKTTLCELARGVEETVRCNTDTLQSEEADCDV